MNEAVRISKAAATNGMEIFLRNFSHVPDDKLTWKPVPSAKSALRIGAHTALYAGRFAQMIRDRFLPQVTDIDAFLAEREAEELAITSREEVERIFRAGTEEALAALDGLSDEDVELSLDSGQGWSMSMRFLMGLPGWHSTLHCGQIDYLQTCWDDHQIYVG